MSKSNACKRVLVELASLEMVYIRHNIWNVLMDEIADKRIADTEALIADTEASIAGARIYIEANQCKN